MQERREIPRWQVKERARYALSSSLKWEDCILQDINLKGMSLSLTQNTMFRNPLDISLAVEDGFTLRVEGKACWEKLEGGLRTYGVAFTRIFDDDKERLYQFIQKHCERQFKDKWWEGAEPSGP
jgi:hypothetical protein